MVDRSCFRPANVGNTTLLILLAIVGFSSCTSPQKRDKQKRRSRMVALALDYQNWESFATRLSESHALGFDRYSWRLCTLLDVGFLEIDPHLSWNSPKNEQLRQTNRENYTDGKNPKAEVFAIVGDGTAFDPTFLKEKQSPPGATLLFIESFIRDIHWMEPGDIDVKEFQNGHDMTAIVGNVNSFWVFFADRVFAEVRIDVPSSELLKLTTVATASDEVREHFIQIYCIKAYNGFRKYPW